MSGIDNILWLLKDGKWHGIKQIEKETALSTFKTELALKFLNEYDFIHLNKNNDRAKIQPSTQRFIKQIILAEEENSSRN